MAANSINLKFDPKNVRRIIFAAVSEVQEIIYRPIQSVGKISTSRNVSEMAAKNIFVKFDP